MILRCLSNDAQLISLGAKFVRLATAVKEDGKGDVNAARESFDKLEGVDLGEFDLLWKRRVEFMFAVDERKAMVTTLLGVNSFSMPVIIHTMEQLLEYTKDESLKIQIYLYLQSMSSKYTLAGVAKIYEQQGDDMMAREYHEIGGRLGNKDSQRWMVEYLGKKKNKSWFNKSAVDREFAAWKTLAELAPQEKINTGDTTST